MSCTLEHMLALVDARSAELTEMRTLRERIAELEAERDDLREALGKVVRWVRFGEGSEGDAAEAADAALFNAPQTLEVRE